MIMKNVVIFAGIFFSLLFTSSCNNGNLIDYQAEADSIAAKYAPDSRTAIFNVKVSENKGSVILKGETTVPDAKKELINTLGKRGILLTDSIQLLPDSSVNRFMNGLACLSVINLRKEPVYASELVSQSLMGTPLKILKKENSWYLVQGPDRYIAWTESASLIPVTASDMDKWKNSDRIIYMHNTGWIYSGISVHSGVVSDIVAGDILEKIGKSGDYTKVKIPDGREGFILSAECMDFRSFCDRPPADGKMIIKRAESLLGIPYLWGGSSPKAADCSGFVQSIYFMNGIVLMRDASLQALHGKTVDTSEGFGNLEEGDLLFFGYRKKGEMRVIHAAIYKGNQEYINSAGRVRFNSFDSTKANFSSYRSRTFLIAKRIIGVVNDPGIQRDWLSQLNR